ncbi:MAG: hypothetical protein H7841_14210 [Magnetospirillum sp. WYHS-4]
MRPEHLLLGAGMVFVVGLAGVAMVPDDAWDRDVSNASAAVTNVAGTGSGAVDPAHMSPDGAAGLGGAAGVGTAPRAWNAAMPGLTPFTRASSVRFSGQVTEMVSLGNDIDWRQVHVWLGGGPGVGQGVSLAPDWFLGFQGCPVAAGDNVAGVAFNFDAKTPNSALYAKTISVNGKKCRLRNDEGFALWSNRLQ